MFYFKKGNKYEDIGGGYTTCMIPELIITSGCSFNRTNMEINELTLTTATEQDREQIYAIRHAVYANEIGQHHQNESGLLKDELDQFNHYIVARIGQDVKGFISITPPAAKKFSIDKYFQRSEIPFPFDEHLFEIRLLTVVKENRYDLLATALMYAAFRWVQAHGGLHIVAICRSELLDMYKKAGLKPIGIRTTAGAVTYELSVLDIDEQQRLIEKHIPIFESIRRRVDWKLPFSFFTPSECYHGGSFFKAIGEDLQTPEKANEIINADVLDAWFPPSPKLIEIIHQNLPWLLQTSPPTHSEGLIKVIAETRGIPEKSILPAAGSSDLIFLALRTLLDHRSKVLIIDPSYGEYVHVLEKIIQCKVDRFKLSRESGFRVDTTELLKCIRNGYNLVVIVNPNSPTGVYIPADEMKSMLSEVPHSTLVWVDETYIEYAGTGKSLENFAATSMNVIVCKSMSKVYALSGARCAYICCSPHIIELLRSLTPPWAVSLPAQAAAITALKDPDYYNAKYEETHRLRDLLKKDLETLGVTEIIDGSCNFLLFYLPQGSPPTSKVLEYCRQRNLYLRDVSNMGETLGERAVRMAVKDRETNGRMIQILKEALLH